MIRKQLRTTAFAVGLLATAASAETFPNSIKYKDTGVPNAIAVTAVASIEARALLNRDDTTDVEITTGSFEGEAPTGYLTKVKVGIPTADGVLPVNFNHPESNTFSGNVSGVINGNVVTIDAQVRGLNEGTDHASAQATVAKRPDLTVQFISLPSFPIKGHPALIRAAIVETNRQVGARANARLLIDGVEVDRAENIWVNAGGRVLVTFAPVLDAEDGQHDFTVVVDSVNPGDWDDGNNTLTERGRVFNLLDQYYRWSATATETEFDNYDYQKRPWLEQTRIDQGVTQSFRFEGTIAAAVNLEAVKVTASGVTDGSPLFETTYNDFWVIDTPTGRRCARSFGGPDATICHDPRSNVVTVDVSYATADAIYRSWGWRTRQHPGAPEEPMSTWDTVREETSLQARFGSTVALTFTVSDGTNHWTAEPFITSLTASSTSTSQPYRCSYEWFTDETVCRERRSASTVRTGNAMGFEQ